MKSLELFHNRNELETGVLLRVSVINIYDGWQQNQL